ncbi:MAG TPA: IS200/IS605 family transposase [Candidatus Babeliales bacterium]|nr:IS200/IS605 family transposase [Candidatus Babeliales bacterium]
MVRHNLVYCLAFGLRREDVLLSDPMKDALSGILHQSAEDRQWTMHEVHVNSDHVVMVVQSGPDTSVESMIHHFKNMSDKSMKEQFSQLHDLYQDDCLWADGYEAETVGESDPEAVEEYLDTVLKS